MIDVTCLLIVAYKFVGTEPVLTTCNVTVVVLANTLIFGLLVGAFLRIKRSVKHQDLTLQTNQMYFHIGAFGISTVSVIAL